MMVVETYHNLAVLCIFFTIALGGLILLIATNLFKGKQKKQSYLIEKTDNDTLVDSQLRKKPVRVYLDGCWDVMHSGHYNALRQAKALGDILVVGVHSDEEIARNKREPVMKNEQRMAAVKSCKWADEVVFDVPYSPSIALLDELKCDYCAHGDDMPVAANGKSAYDAVMDRLKIFRRTPGISTTHLIQRLIDAANQPSIQSLNNSLTKPTRSASWSSFLPSSHRISAFSNNTVPKKDDTVIYIDGVFDLFHVGHISALKAAKKMGTFLYVGLYNDDIVRKIMGNCFPIQSLQERVLNVLSCKYVDDVIIGCPFEISESTIKSLHISKVILTKNTLIASNNLERYSYPKKIGILETIETESDFTTKTLMRRIVNDREKLQQQNKNRVEKAKKYVEEQTYVEEQ